MDFYFENPKARLFNCSKSIRIKSLHSKLNYPITLTGKVIFSGLSKQHAATNILALQSNHIIHTTIQ